LQVKMQLLQSYSHTLWSSDPPSFVGQVCLKRNISERETSHLVTQQL